MVLDVQVPAAAWSSHLGSLGSDTSGDVACISVLGNSALFRGAGLGDGQVSSPESGPGF